MREINNTRRREPCTDASSVELFRLAIMHGDQEARQGVQQCFSEVVREWLAHHPNREVLCRLDREDSYVAQTFERFWQVTSEHQQVLFSRLSAVLPYLRASLNGVILDTLRAYSPP